MDLVERKFRILQAIVDDYIVTALPVGSRTISRKYEQNLSSATIRNEMSDLEELGYLDSPHTSAWRVPSYKAYRLYVDRLMKRTPLGAEETQAISRFFDRRMRQMEDVAERAAHALSSVTHYTTAVMTRQTGEDDLKLRHLQLVKVTENTALLLLVTDAGVVKQTPMHVSPGMSTDDLYKVSRMLTERLAGCRLGQVQSILAGIGAEFREQGELLDGMLETLRERTTPEEHTDLVVGGTSNLLEYPEYSDVEKARSLLSVLETREKVIRLLQGGAQMECSVRIGPETGLPETRDCSVVTATYRLGDGRVNTIGVIGPTRMQYGRVISALEYMGNALMETLSGQEQK